MKYKIIDNFLNKIYFKEINKLLNSNNFPWYYNSDISYENKINSLFDFGFYHVFCDDNGFRVGLETSFIKPLLFSIMDAVNSDSIIRARADMTVASPNNHKHPNHVDYEYENISTIFYVNDSDGDTILYKDNKQNINKKIKPVKNRLIIFDGHKLHTGCSPKKYKNRILINSNYNV